MKSIILYCAYKKLSENYQPFPIKEVPDHQTLWIRGKVINEDIAEALYQANPMPGETVLNSIPLQE